MRACLMLLVFIAGMQSHADERSWNVRTSPLGLAVGLMNARLDYKIAGQWMLGAELAGLNRRFRNVDLRAGRVGIGAMYYFHEALEDGAFLDFGVSGSRIKAKTTDTSGREVNADFNNRSLRVLGGYHWFWHPFNLSLAGGLESNSAGDVKIYDVNGNEVDHVKMAPISLALDFSLGLTF